MIAMCHIFNCVIGGTGRTQQMIILTDIDSTGIEGIFRIGIVSAVPSCQTLRRDACNIKG